MRSQISKGRALQWFEQVVCYGEEDVRIAQRASLRNLLAADLFELHYSELAAVRLLEYPVGEGPSVVTERLVYTGDLENA